MDAQALFDYSREVGELAAIMRLCIARREGQVGRIQLGVEFVEDGWVAEEVVYDGLLDAGYRVAAGGDLTTDSARSSFALPTDGNTRNLRW